VTKFIYTETIISKPQAGRLKKYLWSIFKKSIWPLSIDGNQTNNILFQFVYTKSKRKNKHFNIWSTKVFVFDFEHVLDSKIFYLTANKKLIHDNK